MTSSSRPVTTHGSSVNDRAAGHSRSRGLLTICDHAAVAELDTRAVRRYQSSALVEPVAGRAVRR
jgi:hypothetical protein